MNLLKAAAAGALLLLAAPAWARQEAPAPEAEISLWRLDCGEFEIPDYNAFFSDTWDYEPGPKRIVDSCYLIRHGDRYMLWDTGLPAALINNPQGGASLRTTIRDQLARIGVRPGQIELIGISHYHFDHLGQAADFPQAKLVIGAGDLEVLRTRSGQFIQPELLRPWLEGDSELMAVGSDVDVFRDGRVVMLKTPGHTPGHYALLVRLASGPVLLSGDLYHFTEQVENRGVPPFNHDRADTLASFDRYQRIAENLGARTIIQHEPADVAKLPAFPEAAR